MRAYVAQTRRTACKFVDECDIDYRTFVCMAHACEQTRARARKRDGTSLRAHLHRAAARDARAFYAELERPAMELVAYPCITLVN